MGAKENKQLIRDVFGTTDMDKVRETTHEDYTYRSSAGEEVHGLDAMIDFYQGYLDAFEGITLEPENIVAEGDTVYFEYQQTGKHVGEFWGIEPTNNEMDIRITARVKFKDGKMIEQFENFNALKLLRQLDALPKEFDRELEEVTNKIPRTRA